MTADSDLEISLVNEQDLAVDEARLVATAERTARLLGASGRIDLTLAGPERMARLNEEFMGGSGPTDVLAFPVDGFVPAPPDPDGPPVVAGEVIVCPHVAAGAGPDLAGELDLLVAHGVLHVLGHDHDTEEGAAGMREAEFKVTGRSGAQAS